MPVIALTSTFKRAKCSALCGLALASSLCLACPAFAGAPLPDLTKAGGTAASRIEIRDFMFQPATVTVPAGSEITFINLDEEPHTVASKDGKFARSKPLDTDQKFSLRLTAPGEYGFFCTVHPHMTGKIVVAPATAAAPAARP